ncbi:MAG: protein-tyrosine kinase [Butyrivibrio sp.]|nr:protein-tyrosine kinase [Butyrivibrio sp.]
MGNNDNAIEINLGELIAILWGRAYLIISAGIFFALLGLFVSKFVITPTYLSTTKIFILNKEEGASVTYSDVQISTQLTQDYAQLIKSRYVLEEVIQRLNLEEDYDVFSSRVSINTPNDTRIVEIRVEDEDPMMAMTIANNVREVASEHIKNVMDIDAINVVETANVPIEKASPSVSRFTLIGGLLGVLLVSVFVLLGYLMDDTIKSSDDVENYLGMSTLALIPLTLQESGDKGKKKKKSRH